MRSAQFSEKPTSTMGARHSRATSTQFASSPLSRIIPFCGTMLIRRRKLSLIASRSWKDIRVIELDVVDHEQLPAGSE